MRSSMLLSTVNVFLFSIHTLHMSSLSLSFPAFFDHHRQSCCLILLICLRKARAGKPSMTEMKMQLAGLRKPLASTMEVGCLACLHDLKIIHTYPSTAKDKSYSVQHRVLRCMLCCGDKTSKPRI